MWHRKDRCGPAGDAAQNSKKSRAEDANKDCAMHLSRDQHKHQAETKTCWLHLAVRKLAETHECRGIGHDEVRIPKSHKRDEHPNSGCCSMFQAVWHAIHDLFADTG